MTQSHPRTDDEGDVLVACLISGNKLSVTVLVVFCDVLRKVNIKSCIRECIDPSPTLHTQWKSV